MSRARRLTGQEAFNRLFWDPRLNRDSFTVGYSDRMAPGGVAEVPLARWDASGNVPWHRILFFRCGGEVVWSREEYVDRLASEELPAEAWLGQQALPPQEAVGAMRPRAVYRHRGDAWEVAREAPDHPDLSTFRLANWNVLNDFADPALPSLLSRLPLVREELARTQADVIALQEATPAFARELLSAPRPDPIFVSEPPNLAGLEPHGPLLLSRLPFSLMEYAAGHRPVLVGTWRFAGRVVHIANLHLPSNRTADAGLHRRRLLSGLLEALAPLSGDVLVVGDFNLTGDELADVIAGAGYRDVWAVLHPGDDGPTFDPTNNPLARRNTRTGVPARLDRVLCRCARGGFAPARIERFATSPHAGPEGPLFASDHAGLCTHWRHGALAEVAPVHTSALALIPPPSLWPSIQAIREKHDKQIHRWMPHINLLYGFIPEEHFAAAAPLIAEALAGLAPFEIELEGYDTFTHRHSCTAWLRPVTDPPGALHALQARLEQLFPLCNEQSRRSEVGFTPHLSVGQFRSPAEAHRALPAWVPLRWHVGHVTLIARRGDTPFRSLYEVPFGGAGRAVEPASAGDQDIVPWLDRLQPEASAERQQACRMVVEQLDALVAGLTGWAGAVYLSGSWRMGVAGPNSDVDVICLHPPHLPSPDFLRQLHGRLADRAEGLCLALEARVPKLSFRLCGLPVDVLAAGASRPELPVASSDCSEAASWQAARACVEADLLLEAAGRAMPLPTFRRLLRAVRAWATARRVDGNAWGFLGGFSWALLAAWSALQPGRPGRDASPTSFMRHFFEALARHRWPLPVTINEASGLYQPQGPRDRLPIVRPVAPFENTAYNITRSTARTLRSEWARAVRLFEGGGEVLPQLFAPADLPQQSERFLVLSLGGPPAARAGHVGQMEGRIVGLLVGLERGLHLFVRPWPGAFDQGGVSRVVVGLPALRPRDERRVREYVRGFLDELGGGWQADLCDRASGLLPS